MPIVNPDEAIREGYSHLSQLNSASQTQRSHPLQQQGQGQVNPKVEVLQSHPLYHPTVQEEQNKNLDQILGLHDGSRSFSDIEMVKTYPPEQPPNNRHVIQQQRIDPDGNVRYADGQPINLSSSMTHIRILDIEVDQEKFGKDGDETDSNNFVDKPARSLSSRSRSRDAQRSIPKAPDGAEYAWNFMPRRQYKVGLNLKSDWAVQAAFFSKIMLIKALQLAFINLWIFVVGVIPTLQSFTIGHHDWFYLAIAIFVGLLIVIRLIARSKSNWHPAVTAIGMILLTICIAYSLASVTHKYDAFAIPTVTWVLFLTCLLLAPVPYLIRVPITETAVTRSGGILVLLVSVIMLVVSVYTSDINITDFGTYVWLPSVLIAELVLWVMICEIQRIILGWSFHVSERRWFFAALYI